jgi:uncharacterized protein (TIGR02466 family)
MSRSQIIPIFPTPIVKVDRLLKQDLVRRVIDHSRAAGTERNTKSDLLAHTRVIDPASDQIFRSIGELLNPRLVEFDTLLFGERLVWKIKEMWVNILEPGGQQSMHSHANSFVSGAIYLTRSHPSARTVFYRNLGGSDYTFSNHNSNADVGPFNAPKWATPEVEPGDLILFPSCLLHEVPRNAGAQRTTIALNAIPTSLKSAGSTKSPLLDARPDGHRSSVTEQAVEITELNNVWDCRGVGESSAALSTRPR